MALLVLLVFAGLLLTASRWPSRHGIRESLLRAALAFGAIVTVSTEALSVYDEIKASNVFVLWLLLTIAAWIAAISAGGITGVRDRPSGKRPRLPVPYVIACVTILVGILVVAILAPPNYADALTYHMGRVAHWIQNRSLDYYPTGIGRQNNQMPFAEYVILHLQLLSGGDRWANLVQWAAFALSGLTVSLILADLGQPARVQWIGAIVAFTIPMAILEASGAQNDVVVSLWLLAFLLYLWRALSDHSLESAVLSGLALGLALATKGTAYLYAPAMGGVLVASWLVGAPRGLRFPPLRNLVAACLVAACVNLGPWSRNMLSYGTPICCGKWYFVERMTPGDAISNVLRNVALHLNVPKLTGVVERGVDILSPVDLDDPATTMPDTQFEISFSYNEGKAGNTLHLLAFLGATLIILVDRRLRRGPAKTWLAAAVASLLVFSVALKWQPWESRLHTPVFLLASIPIALALGSRGRAVAAVVLAAFFAGSLPYVFLNQQRPILPFREPSIFSQPRGEQYLPEFPEWADAFTRAGEFVKASGEPEIGLLFREIDYEYVLWVRVKDDFAGPPGIRHVGVDPIPGRPPPPAPPAIVITSREGERHDIDGIPYVRIRDFGELSVLQRAAR